MRKISKLFHYSIISIQAFLCRIWLNSLSIKCVNSSVPPKNALIALWHEHLPICMKVFNNYGYAVLISKSKDGSLASKICSSWGYAVFRGSSSRGGATGLKKLKRYLQNKNGLRLAGMALDGPHGPYHKIQPGTVWLSKSSNIPIFPVAIYARNKIRLRNWDKTIIPIPFTKVFIKIGKPIFPQSNSQLEKTMSKIQQELSQNP
jgi:lysophospholipid acyltransferase (LPLAT)-like uncharacterized protein